MQSNHSFLLFESIFGLATLIFLVVSHWETFIRYKSLLFKVNLITSLIALPANEIAYHQTLWSINPSNVLGVFLDRVPLEDVLFTIICTSTISFVTILVKNYHLSGKKFRANFWKKN